MGTHLKLSERWFLAPEFKPLSQKGVNDIPFATDIPSSLNATVIRSDLNLNYIDIPVLLQYRMPNNFYFSAGPQISFLTTAQQKTDLSLNDNTLITVDENVMGSFNSIDVSFPAEIGYAIRSERAKDVDIRLRYTHGFMDVFTESSPYSANNSTIQFFLTFPFVGDGE